MSKGSNRRPQDVPDSDVDANWRRIFERYEPRHEPSRPEQDPQPAPDPAGQPEETQQ